MFSTTMDGVGQSRGFFPFVKVSFLELKYRLVKSSIGEDFQRLLLPCSQSLLRR